jgi:FAD/FMN-containing dehydrogenase
MRRIIEHEPADLVATAEAGVTLSEFNEELGRAVQWLPLDPPDNGRATLGGVAATGNCGAQSLGYGAPRGFVIGMRAALADGKVVKAGGRVVKNVAGYDLCKLFTGSYGTLCLILELTFKLRPVPVRTATLMLQAPLASLFRAAQMVMRARLLPVAVEMLSHGLAERLSIPDGSTQASLLIRFAGAPATVAYQIEQTTRLLRGEEPLQRSAIVNDDEKPWRGLAAVPLQTGEHLIWRANLLPTRLGEFLERMGRDNHPAFSSSSLWQAGLADGRLRVISSYSEETNSIVQSLEKARATARALGGTLVLENALPDIKSAFDAWGEMGAAGLLMRRVKQQLDPAGAFSPGRFFEST